MIYFPFQKYTNLGNWLFQYATALSVRQPVIGYIEDPLARMKLVPYEDLFADLKLVDELPSGISEYEQPKTPHILQFNVNQDVLLRGYYQSDRFFDEGLVRQKFSPSLTRRQYLYSKYGDWLCRKNVTGISVRRGDYLKIPERHPFVGKRYFVDCITRLQDVDDFIVCSDDIAWCKHWFPKQFQQKRFLFVENETVLDQLYIHVFCRHNIISNSTFSWWGAWLNENPRKRVLAPDRWFGIEYVHAGVKWKDIYFDGVEIVPIRWCGLKDLCATIVFWYKKTRMCLGAIKQQFKGRPK